MLKCTKCDNDLKFYNGSLGYESYKCPLHGDIMDYLEFNYPNIEYYFELNKLNLHVYFDLQRNTYKPLLFLGDFPAAEYPIFYN